MAKWDVDMDKRALSLYHHGVAEKLGLFFDPEVHRLIDSFAYCFRVKVTVFSSEMEELIVGLQNPGSTFCRLIQSRLRIRYRCCRLDKLMCEQCGQSRKLTVYRCHVGLSEAILPIEVEGRLIGYGMLGQFRTMDSPLPEAIAEWTGAGMDESVLIEAYQQQPLYDQQVLDNMLALFSMMISYIVSRDYVRVRQARTVERVLSWLEDHMSETVELEEVAEALGCSRSAISHALKRHLGMSFKEVATMRKVQKFESIIARDPYTSVQNAALAVGYEDPLYFSRVYKKLRLAPPSVYARSMRDRGISS